jgi:hypothetical protein
MKFSVLTSMAMVVGGLLSVASPALAVQVSYTTCAVINNALATGAPCGLPGNPFGTTGNTYASGGITLTINGATPNIMEGDTPFDGNIAHFGVTEAPNSTLTLNALPFSIYIYQTLPGLQSGVLAGSVSGTIKRLPPTNNASGSYVANFAPGNQQIILAGVVYTLDLQTGGACAAGDGCTIIPVTPAGKDLTAFITASPVPEPTFYTLSGLGFAGLLGMAFRRRRQNQA